MKDKPTTPFNREKNLEDRISPDRALEVLLPMIDKAFKSDVEASKSIENITFRYVAALLAVLLAILSKGIVFDDIYTKFGASFSIILFVLLATIDLMMKHKQHADLGKVLVHLEDIVGCYTSGHFIKNATLLPEEWLDNSENYIGRRVTPIRLFILWSLACIGCVTVWFSS